MKKEEYFELVEKAITKVLKDPVIIFFGSLVEGNFSKRLSDIDVAVYVGRPLSAEEYWKLIGEFENLPILKKIDLVDLAEVKDRSFLKRVLEKGILWKGSKENLKSLREH
ncbi:MAG: nucleotidyltransferase domain-containing protein [Thermodesulfobacteria bacterium]|nr:nucleotidyltransferase domain-containing protein [Thermodesulfobacteriota bacterium]